MKLLYISAFALLFPLGTNAQDRGETKTRPAQVTFVTPLGTNGDESGNITNYISFNLILGYNGGLKGGEFSGFGGAIKGDMSGVQFAGFCNNVLGDTEGAQFAGFYNYNNSIVEGAQFAGFSNIVVGSVKGFQAAGFLNYAQGGRLFQTAGFSNVVSDDIDGVQIAGFANIASSAIKGMQAGVFNYAKRLDGIQIGVINVTDSLEQGVAIGFITIIKNGYRTLEISASETLHGIMSFKTGSNGFYNIFSLGAALREKEEMILWGWGYGVGTLVPVNERVGISLEGVAYHINENEWFTNRLNLLNRLNGSLSVELAEHLTIFGGASWNVVVSATEDEYGNSVESKIPTGKSNYDHTFANGINVKMYPGFNAGIRF